MDRARLSQFIERRWEESILPALAEYIRIPNVSPAFDADWRRRGHMDEAVALMERWCRAEPVDDMRVEVVRLEGRTPLLLVEVPGSIEHTVLLYGHLDKQPPMSGWREGLGPWTPVREGDRLYGRGGADDGYALFASLSAIRALREQGVAHARCVVLIEACEESGSYDLPHYVQALQARIGSPDLVICLDSGCGSYDRLWCTTSLRGLAGGTLSVQVLEQGVHSGDAGGIVPSSFRILRQLLSRIEDEREGRLLPGALSAQIPPERSEQAGHAAELLGAQVYRKFPFVRDPAPALPEPRELILRRTWRPALEVTGADGLPAVGEAGNVLRPFTSAKLSVRLPPTCDARAAAQALQQVLEADPPAGARVRFEPELAMDGWNSPPLAPWLGQSLERSSQAFFDQPPAYMGEGGSIPFIGMLAGQFPAAQLLVTGVLGPHSNAHGPNEFLHIPTAKRLTACVAALLADHGRHAGGGS